MKNRHVWILKYIAATLQFQENSSKLLNWGSHILNFALSIGLKLETLSHTINVYAAIKAQRETAIEYYVEYNLMNISTKWLVLEKSEWGDIWNLLPAEIWTKTNSKCTTPHYLW